MFLDRFNLEFFFGSFLGFGPLATGDTGVLTRSLEQGEESSIPATGDTGGLTGSLAQGDESSLIIDIRLIPSSIESLSSLVP